MLKKDGIVLDVHEKPNIITWLTLGFQHLFAMFGSTICFILAFWNYRLKRLENFN
ncbi:hypothetical protein P9251_04015 [Metabacillus fastidiosus]|uniref:Uncharacterized protein n=1 Tax=Metabacillus fastidiosus TaxID=1458 RepID=A0ABU6NZ43_9BACI|nr:hypothetical protein [Metabacillus fastidiosus]MED4452798.1 hypothetical protein [Metabacillus fastidiosus]